MPTLDDLNEIKSNLLSIGDEPGILAAKGEVPVDIGPPETGLSDDLNALFDDFADVEEEGTETGEPEAGIDGLDDFDFDLGDEESAFDMDGFDAPEDEGIEDGSAETGEPEAGVGEDELPDGMSGAEELDLSLEDDLGFGEEDLGIIPDELVPDDLIPEPVEGEGTEDGEPETGAGEDEFLDGLVGEEDLGIIPDELVPDDLIPEPVEGDEDLGFAEEMGISLEDDFDFGEEEPGPIPDELVSDDLIPEPVEGDEDLGFAEELDLSVEDDLGFGEEEFGSIPDGLVPEIVEGDEGMDFDLSGEGPGFDDTDGSADFGLPGDEIELGDDEELAFDDSSAGDLDLGEFEIGDESLDEELEIDEFDLGDLGQDFGVLEEDLSAIPDDSVPELAEGGVDSELEEEEFEIDEQTFDRVKATLLTLPRNLKLIIEEEIGEKGLKGPSLKKLIDALAEGKTPKEIATITSRITGKKIKIPANYAKRTGLDFEEEKGSFQYTLIHNILPLLKIFAISIVIIAALSFVSYKFIYRPVHARILYNRGWEQLEKGNYDSSSDLFDQAFDKYKIKKQFYRYSEGYIDANQWTFARMQYDKLLDNYPFDKKGTIDYATMEFEKLADYEHSTELLTDFLEGSEKHKRDYDALLLMGDIYLEWGWIDKARYDDARLAYAKIMSTYGVENVILFRMLKFFIRTDNAKEVDILKERFQADKDIKIDPEAYAELAGY
ncbi:MAG: hypothetical protein KAR21_13965, partial [Spirochaetales bacterium]|nr:hypothetical protein [Spirochaetales bacterium]